MEILEFLFFIRRTLYKTVTERVLGTGRCLVSKTHSQRIAKSPHNSTSVLLLDLRCAAGQPTHLAAPVFAYPPLIYNYESSWATQHSSET
ncbi:hypothetical protein AVEN_36173-1 [Araneus ventricosus]|uniref:Uncharacterized protein n=1 Tax=Araneus ventricosus TaxID=182803 RepID=A0A4Y2PSR8_ARAVE|nr:hypothetical protein AVEN_36173-1 [Araneus ventricosus]